MLVIVVAIAGGLLCAYPSFQSSATAEGTVAAVIEQASSITVSQDGGVVADQPITTASSTLADGGSVTMVTVNNQ